MTYKDRFYKEYVSTHIVQRKGSPTLETFNSKSATWEKTFRRFLPENKEARILDMGCGDGRIVWWLQRIGYLNSEGVDISPEQIAVARQLGVKNIYQADLTTFLWDRTFYYDVIILRNVIEHFKKDKIVEILEICRSSLRDNGKLIIQAPNAESPFFGRIRYGDFTHEVAFCSSSLLQVFNVVGLTGAEFYPVEPVFKGQRAVIRFLLWRMVEGLYKLLLFAELGPGNRIVSQDILAIAVKLNRES